MCHPQEALRRRLEGNFCFIFPSSEELVVSTDPVHLGDRGGNSCGAAGLYPDANITSPGNRVMVSLGRRGMGKVGDSRMSTQMSSFLTAGIKRYLKLMSGNRGLRGCHESEKM